MGLGFQAFAGGGVGFRVSGFGFRGFWGAEAYGWNSRLKGLRRFQEA